MKLFAITFILGAFTFSCTNGTENTVNKESNLVKPAEKKFDREYINHLYGSQNDPLKNWSDGMKKDADIKNGKGC